MKPSNPEQNVALALSSHPKSGALLMAGKQRNQLLRSLVPLYIAKDIEVDLNSGQIARVWKRFKVRYAGPNAAKALREHTGYAKRTANGRRITRAGVKYVETALKALKTAKA